MGNKNQNTMLLNWTTTTPVPFVPNTPPSGVTAGVMTGTSTIYSQIIDVTIKDNQGLELTWTGTPTGTIQIMGSSSGANFYALTFSPLLAQPAGAAGGYLIDLNQFPWKYLMVQYTNASGSGLLTTWLTTKDLN
jgi:hypothetical protein